MRSTTIAAVLVLAAGQAAGQWSDDFNRADGALGGSWTTFFGNIADFSVAGHRGLHTLGTHDAVTSTTASGKYSWYSQSVDLPAGLDTVKYAALLSGLGGTHNLFIKVQSNGSGPYDSVGFYSDQSSGAGWTGASPTFVSIPAFASGQMQVYFTDAGDTINLAIDTNMDGIPEQLYSRGGVKAFSASFGQGFGLGAYGEQAIDNWRVMPGIAPARQGTAVNVIPFGNGTTDTQHQVFRSGLWPCPVRIVGVRFAPGAVGVMASNIAVSLGYTGRVPGVASPAGLSAPSGTSGAPNASGPMFGFYSNPTFTQTISTTDSENFQLSFGNPGGFVYFPGVGNLLMQVTATTAAGAPSISVSRADGSADSSRSYNSTVFGAAEDTIRAERVQFISMPVIPDVLPTGAHAAFNFLPFSGGSGVTHQVHHAGTLAPLGDGGKVAIQGLRFAPSDGKLTADVDVRLGYTARTPGVVAPTGLSVPTGFNGEPNASGSLTSFYTGHVDHTFSGSGPDNFQLDLHQRPFVYDPALGNLLISNFSNGSSGVFAVSRTVGSPEASRTASTTTYGAEGANSLANRVKFVTTPVTEQAYPGVTDGLLYAPFGFGQHVTQQVFASSLFGTAPIRIDSIAYAPLMNGAYSGTFRIRLGYTSRQPNVAPPAGLSAPDSGGGGVPNASLSPMADFWVGTLNQTVAGAGAENYQFRFPADVPFLYNPAMGNLLVEVFSTVPATTTSEAVGAWNSATSASSCAVTSSVYGTSYYPNYAPRVKFTYFKDLYPCVADLTGDGTVDLLDFFGFFGCFDVTSSCADVNSDGSVDLLDFFAFFDSWDAGC